MFRIITIIILLTIPFTGTSQTGSFEYQGYTRNYIVHLPPGYTPGSDLPLVLNLHGLGSSASEQEAYTQFNTVADTADFIVVYPNALPSDYGTAWNSGIGINTAIDDVGFISALIDTINENYGTDLNRVYSTGLSNGGFMSQRLACELDDRIAAIASVAGTIGNYFTCNPTRAVPVMHIHGTSDAVVDYNGDTYCYSVDNTILFWVQQDDCPTTPVITQIPDIVTSDNCTATKSYYGLCQDSSEVVLFTINNGGHTWPGSPYGGNGNTNMDIIASGEIWDFFYRHKLNNTTSSEDPSLLNPENTGQSVTCFPNPFSDNINIKPNTSGIISLEIFNLLGEKIFERSFNNIRSEKSDVIRISAGHLEKGIYLLKVNTNNSLISFVIFK